MSKCVLIVDDEPLIVAALATRLAARGFRVVQAMAGSSAIEAAVMHEPDAIVMDIRLPDMDGFDACEHIRKQPGLARTPIVFLSAHSQESYRKRALEAGGNLFLAKPYKAADVLAAIDRLIAEAPSPIKEGLSRV